MSNLIIDEQLIEQEFTIVPAKQGKRFGNYLVDYIVLQLLAVGIGVAMHGSIDEFLFSDAVLAPYAIAFFLNTIYYTILEASTGKSLGKYITKTTVIKADGTRPDMMNILGRSLCRFIPFDAFSFLGERGWHDSISKTYVVEDHTLPSYEYH